jgi:hypothetical protein
VTALSNPLVVQDNLERAYRYLEIPPDSVADLGGLKWSRESADEIVRAQGTHFAFAAQLAPLLGGLASVRPLLPFPLILRFWSWLGTIDSIYAEAEQDQLTRLTRAYVRAGNPLRNLGILLGVLTQYREIAGLPAPPPIEDVGRVLTDRRLRPLLAVRPIRAGAALPSGVWFGDLIRRGLAGLDDSALIHWLRHGCAPEPDRGDDLADAWDSARPPSLEGKLAGWARRERLAGVASLIGPVSAALTLPARSWRSGQVPEGGYVDVTNRGSLDRLLPHQLALDPDEFLRRYADRELLFYRREEPHAPVTRELLVVIDQGVRTWGAVRIRLAAALLALGSLAARRGWDFRVAGTSNGGKPLDPLATSEEEMGALLDASDLSPHPAWALLEVLAEPGADGRDIVLLTHPRNLDEPDVVGAAGLLSESEGLRLFAIATDEGGAVEVSESSGGWWRRLSRFKVEAAAAPVPRPLVMTWSGRVASGTPRPTLTPEELSRRSYRAKETFLAFDQDGNRLLLAAKDGRLQCWNLLTGGPSEILPGPETKGYSRVRFALGVTGGFALLRNAEPAFTEVVHYDFASRRVESRGLEFDVKSPSQARYLRPSRAIRVPKQGFGSVVVPLGELSTARLLKEATLIDSDNDAVVLDESSGRIFVIPRENLAASAWDTGMFRRPYELTPMSDGAPALRGARQVGHRRAMNTLAVLVRWSNGGLPDLWLFELEEAGMRAWGCIPRLRRQDPVFALSADGRRLAVLVESLAVYDVRDLANPRILIPEAMA